MKQKIIKYFKTHKNINPLCLADYLNGSSGEEGGEGEDSKYNIVIPQKAFSIDFDIPKDLDLFGKTIDDLQRGAVFSDRDGEMSALLKEVTDYTGFDSSIALQSGYYIAFRITADNVDDIKPDNESSSDTYAPYKEKKISNTEKIIVMKRTPDTSSADNRGILLYDMPDSDSKGGIVFIYTELQRAQ